MQVRLFSFYWTFGTCILRFYSSVFYMCLWLFYVFLVLYCLSSSPDLLPTIRISWRLLRVGLLVDALHNSYLFALHWQQKLGLIDELLRLDGWPEEMIILGFQLLTMKGPVKTVIDLFKSLLLTLRFLADKEIIDKWSERFDDRRRRCFLRFLSWRGEGRLHE